MNKLCAECRYCQHPEWAMLMPGYKICGHDRADDTGRLDIQRTVNDDKHCGPEGKWWEAI